MNEMLVIYDLTGRILTKSTGFPRPIEPVGVPFLWVEVPEGKEIKSVGDIGIDVSISPHLPILHDKPKTELDILREQLQATQEAVDFLLFNGVGE